MTLLEPELEAEAEPELSRLTLVVGELNIDVGLPAHVSIAQYIPDVIDIANEQITNQDAIVEFDAADGRWTLAPLGGAPIEPHLSLGEAGVHDGDLLMICAVGQPVSPLLFDDVDDTHAAAAGTVRSWLADKANALAGFGVTAAAAVTMAGVVARWTAQPAVPAAVLALGVTGMVLACLVAHRPAAAAAPAWITAVSTPLVFAGSLYLVPGGSGATSLPMAFALTAFGALLVLLVSGSGSAVYTAIITACAFGGVSSTAMLLWQAPIRAVGALLATVAVIVVYLAPRVTIGLSKLPIPRVPTAGEPLDDIETQGGPTVEGVNAIGKQIIPTEEDLISRVRRANQHLTGILVAAALAALVGCYLAVDVSDGFYWQGTVFAVMVATVLCLRGRGHHDLVQSATLIGSGLTIAVAVVLKTALNVEGWQARAVVVLLALMVLILACGLVAPLREFSPVARRQVEILEYIAVGSLFPLCFWIVRVYAFFREMRL
ncbi:type VII secretion integral membrane protein EccD [Mycolicibacterium porcinum]